MGTAPDSGSWTRALNKGPTGLRKLLQTVRGSSPSGAAPHWQMGQPLQSKAPGEAPHPWQRKASGAPGEHLHWQLRGAPCLPSGILVMVAGWHGVASAAWRARGGLLIKAAPGEMAAWRVVEWSLLGHRAAAGSSGHLVATAVASVVCPLYVAATISQTTDDQKHVTKSPAFSTQHPPPSS